MVSGVLREAVAIGERFMKLHQKGAQVSLPPLFFLVAM